MRFGWGFLLPLDWMFREDFLRRPTWLERVMIDEETVEVIRVWLLWSLNC